MRSQANGDCGCGCAPRDVPNMISSSIPNRIFITGSPLSSAALVQRTCTHHTTSRALYVNQSSAVRVSCEGSNGSHHVTIGSLAQHSGLRPSAIRYYERMGLLPAPQRRSGRRDYDPDAVPQLAVVQFALSTGFTLRDTRQLVRGFSRETAASTRWRALAATKMA